MEYIKISQVEGDARIDNPELFTLGLTPVLQIYRIESLS